jgi:hypothetical protein
MKALAAQRGAAQRDAYRIVVRAAARAGRDPMARHSVQAIAVGQESR